MIYFKHILKYREFPVNRHYVVLAAICFITIAGLGITTYDDDFSDSYDSPVFILQCTRYNINQNCPTTFIKIRKCPLRPFSLNQEELPSRSPPALF